MSNFPSVTFKSLLISEESLFRLSFFPEYYGLGLFFVICLCFGGLFFVTDKQKKNPPPGSLIT